MGLDASSLEGGLNEIDSASRVQERIRLIEEVAADAVPAAVVETLDGWRLRFNHGVNRRPNSVLANADGGAEDIEVKIGRAEAFYAAYGLRARFQLSPASVPVTLDAVLAARGYLRPAESVCVQVAPLGEADETPKAAARDVILLERPTETWLGLYNDIEGLTGVQATALRDMLGKLPGSSVFALTHDRTGCPAATGVGVIHGGLLGIFNVATHLRARRQGLATALTAELCAWGSRRGAGGAYLQVAANNAPAQNVYGRLGFGTLYTYFYREQP